MDGEKVALIDALLDRIADEHKVFLPLAIESGSRAWGFSSPDSDYDCRFVFVRRIAEHITPWPARDVIEFPPEDDLDANGWDLGKALRLLLKGNAVIVEWLRSPVVYRGQAWFRDGFLEFARHAATREAIGRHYLHLGERQRRVYFGDGTSVAQKKIFYALRPAATLRDALPDADGGMRSPGRVEQGGRRSHAPQTCDPRAWRGPFEACRRALSRFGIRIGAGVV
jgi:predicted nucleotidyltransferase